MRWLAIEASSPCVSMALGQDDHVLREVSGIGNASVLVEPLFRELTVDLDQIDQCVLGQGPGSYNGLRVGYAFLKGLLCLQPLPVVEIPSPLTMAQLALEKLAVTEATLLVLNNARRNEIYAALVDCQTDAPRLRWQTVCDTVSLSTRLPEKLDAVVGYDDIVQSVPALAGRTRISILPTAATAGRLAHRLKQPPAPTLSQLTPHYVRAPVPSV